MNSPGAFGALAPITIVLVFIAVAFVVARSVVRKLKEPSVTENYTLGYSEASIAIMAFRTAENHAGFFLSHLKPGMRVLDIGCGPGTITYGLAQKVVPGQVIGIELDLAQTEPVLERAQAAGLNLIFEQANAYDLPYDNDSFDAVFLSAVVGNLQRPEQMFGEVFRVLKPSGVVGVKEFNHSSNIVWPETQFLTEVNKLYERLRLANGHDPDSGRRVPGLLVSAAFAIIDARATFDTIPRPEGTGSPIMEAMVREEWGPQFVERGWATPEEVEKMIQASQIYKPGLDFFQATAWVEVLAIKPG